jgi:hypothetical protein
MKLGTENKKQLIILGVLVVIMGYFFYSNVLSGPSAPSPSSRSTARSAAPAATPGMPPPVPQAAPSMRRAGNRERSEEFHPVYLNPNPAKRPDVTKIDPTLRLDYFQKVQQVELAGGARNLFQFSTAPPPKETVKVAAGPEPKVHIFAGPRLPPPPAPPPPPPPPPPITLKFYGYSLSKDTGKRTAYLLDGDEIYLAAEGDTLKRKYKILRIQQNSILIEDLDAKRQQSVPLQEEAAG